VRPQDINLTNSKLRSLYFHELWWLASSIVAKCEKLFNETVIPDSGYQIQVSPELHSLIASVLSDAANIKKLITTPSAKLRNESGVQTRLRKERARTLKALFNSIALNEILKHKVRNTLEHFDEYLDQANVKLTKAANPPSPMAAYNMILSHWEAFNPRVYPIRVYISSEKTYYNMKWSINIESIYNEASAMLTELNKIPDLTQEDGPGGLMLRLDT